MLAFNFMTAKALGIDDTTWNALVRLLGMMERGEIKDLPIDWGAEYPLLEDGPLDFFNMRMVSSRYSCGTAGCLLGWVRSMGAFSGEKLHLLREKLPPFLSALFALPESSLPLEVQEHACTVDVATAMLALRNYLTTGDAQWEEVLA